VEYGLNWESKGVISDFYKVLKLNYSVSGFGESASNTAV
jgi:hypothetical protein